MYPRSEGRARVAACAVRESRPWQLKLKTLRKGEDLSARDSQGQGIESLGKEKDRSHQPGSTQVRCRPVSLCEAVPFGRTITCVGGNLITRPRTAVSVTSIADVPSEASTMNLGLDLAGRVFPGGQIVHCNPPAPGPNGESSSREGSVHDRDVGFLQERPDEDGRPYGRIGGVGRLRRPTLARGGTLAKAVLLAVLISLAGHSVFVITRGTCSGCGLQPASELHKNSSLDHAERCRSESVLFHKKTSTVHTPRSVGETSEPAPGARPTQEQKANTSPTAGCKDRLSDCVDRQGKQCGESLFVCQHSVQNLTQLLRIQWDEIFDLRQKEATCAQGALEMANKLLDALMRKSTDERRLSAERRRLRRRIVQQTHNSTGLIRQLRGKAEAERRGLQERNAQGLQLGHERQEKARLTVNLKQKTAENKRLKSEVERLEAMNENLKSKLAKLSGSQSEEEDLQSLAITILSPEFVQKYAVFVTCLGVLLLLRDREDALHKWQGDVELE